MQFRLLEVSQSSIMSKTSSKTIAKVLPYYTKRIIISLMSEF